MRTRATTTTTTSAPCAGAAGRLIAIDNVLWSGRVVDESDQDADTQAIRALNEKIAVDERVDLAMTPIAMA